MCNTYLRNAIIMCIIHFTYCLSHVTKFKCMTFSGWASLPDVHVKKAKEPYIIIYKSHAQQI